MCANVLNICIEEQLYQLYWQKENVMENSGQILRLKEHVEHLRFIVDQFREEKPLDINEFMGTRSFKSILRLFMANPRVWNACDMILYAGIIQMLQFFIPSAFIIKL
jgi:hypothetical protein